MQNLERFYYKRMNCDIRPATYGVDWRVFPGLETTAMDEVMCGFPIVVDCWSVFGGLEWNRKPSSQSPIIEYCAATTRGTRSTENIHNDDRPGGCCCNDVSSGALPETGSRVIVMTTVGIQEQKIG